MPYLPCRHLGRREVVGLGEVEHLLARSGDRHRPDAEVPAAAPATRSEHLPRGVSKVDSTPRRSAISCADGCRNLHTAFRCQLPTAAGRPGRLTRRCCRARRSSPTDPPQSVEGRLSHTAPAGSAVASRVDVSIGAVVVLGAAVASQTSKQSEQLWVQSLHHRRCRRRALRQQGDGCHANCFHRLASSLNSDVAAHGFQLPPT